MYAKLLDRLNCIFTFFLVLVGLFFLIKWYSILPNETIAKRMPLFDKEIKELTIQKVDIKGVFERFSGTPSSTSVRWQGFRGDGYDNISRETVPLNGVLKQSELSIIWKVNVGEGYAGPAIGNGCVYLLDYDKKSESDMLRCFSLDNGQEIWRRSYKIFIKRNHGITRTVPAVSEKYVVSIGPKCQVMCVDSKNGEFMWGIDLQVEYGTKVPLWYTGQCPLMDDEVAVIAPGGKALLIGVNCMTGEILFEVPNPDGWQMSHSSVMPMTLKGERMYVYSAIGGMVGVGASGNNFGKVLWKTSEWNHSVISPSPVYVPDNKILVTAGYGAGSMMFEVQKLESIFQITPLFSLDKSIFACEQHTPVFYKGHLFSILPNDAGKWNRQLVCMSPDGKIKWNSGKEYRFGLGPFMIADDKIWILEDNGLLTVVDADVYSFKPLSQVKVLNGREAWAPMAVAGGKLFLRDFEELICLDVRRRLETRN